MPVAGRSAAPLPGRAPVPAAEARRRSARQRPVDGQDGTVSWTVIVPVKRLARRRAGCAARCPASGTRRWCWRWRWTRVAAALASPAVAGSWWSPATRRRGRGARRSAPARGAGRRPDAGLNAALAARRRRSAARPPPVRPRSTGRPAGAAPGRARPTRRRGRGPPTAGRRGFVPTPPAPARCCSPRRRACRWSRASARLGGGARRQRRACRWPGRGRACATTWTPRPTSPPRSARRHLRRCGRGAPRAAAAAAGASTACTVLGMQGTVATFDAETRTGTLLLDDGTALAFPAAAFAASGLRLLRLGQRVRIEHDRRRRDRSRCRPCPER